MVLKADIISLWASQICGMLLFEALRPGQQFSVILGRLPGFNQYLAIGMKCLVQGHFWHAEPA